MFTTVFAEQGKTMFGRKKVTPSTHGLANQSRPSSGQDAVDQGDGVDAAIAIMSKAIGLDLDFGMGYIFAPSLWNDPASGVMLDQNGLKPNMRGNTLALLKNPVSVGKLAAMERDSPLRAALASARIGVALYNPDAENGYADGLVAMQRQKLREFATRTDISDRARHYATMDLMRFSEEVMLGQVKLG